MASWSWTCQHLYPTHLPTECADALVQHTHPKKYVCKCKKFSNITFHSKQKSEKVLGKHCLGNSEFDKLEILHFHTSDRLDTYIPILDFWKPFLKIVCNYKKIIKITFHSKQKSKKVFGKLCLGNGKFVELEILHFHTSDKLGTYIPILDF